MALRNAIKANEQNGENKIPWLKHYSQESSEEEEEKEEDDRDKGEEKAPNNNDDDNDDDGSKAIKEASLLKQAYDLFLWEDVPTSCYAFVASNAVFYALVKLKVSLPALLCQFSIMSIALSFAFGCGPTLLCRYLLSDDRVANPTDALANAVEVPRERVMRAARLAGRAVVEFAEFIKAVITYESPESSLKAGCVFLVLGLLSQKYSVAALLWLAVDFCFVWFPVYKYQRESVDECYDKSLEFAVAQAKSLKEDSSKLVKKYLKTS